MTTLITESDKIRALETVAALAGLLGNDPTWIPLKEEGPKPLRKSKSKEKRVSSCPDFGKHIDNDAKKEKEPIASSLVQPDSVLAWSVDLGRRKRHGKLSDDSFPDEQEEPKRHSSPNSVTLLDQGVIDKFHRGTALPLLNGSDSKKKMRFREKVSIVHIPSHRDVDPEIAKKVWTSPDEVHANLERNAWEFNAVGRDWTKVLEEDQMIFDPVSGEYIHPATWELMEIQRQEELRDQELRRLAQAEKERRARYAMEQQQQQQSNKPHSRQPSEGSPSNKNKLRRRQTGRPVVADEQPPKSRSPKEARRRRKAASLSPPRKTKSGSQSSATTTDKPRSQRSSSVGSRRKPRVMASAGALTRFADT